MIPVADDQSVSILVNLTGEAVDVIGDLGRNAMSIRRAPSRTISSISDRPSEEPSAAAAELPLLFCTTVSTGVPSRQRWRAGLDQSCDTCSIIIREGTPSRDLQILIIARLSGRVNKKSVNKCSTGLDYSDSEAGCAGAFRFLGGQ